MGRFPCGIGRRRARGPVTSVNATVRGRPSSMATLTMSEPEMVSLARSATRRSVFPKVESPTNIWERAAILALSASH
jgi:hypothetical protein